VPTRCRYRGGIVDSIGCKACRAIRQPISPSNQILDHSIQNHPKPVSSLSSGVSSGSSLMPLNPTVTHTQSPHLASNRCASQICHNRLFRKKLQQNILRMISTEVSSLAAQYRGKVLSISVAFSPLLPSVLLEDKSVAFPCGTNAMPIRCGTNGARSRDALQVVGRGTNRGAPSSHPRRSAAVSVSLLGFQVRSAVIVRQLICSQRMVSTRTKAGSHLIQATEFPHHGLAGRHKFVCHLKNTRIVDAEPQ
jgi:hypothetical protein